jgi:hypothetical protein
MTDANDLIKSLDAEVLTGNKRIVILSEDMAVLLQYVHSIEELARLRLKELTKCLRTKRKAIDDENYMRSHNHDE